VMFETGPAAELTLAPNAAVLLFHAATAVIAVGLFGVAPALASRRCGFSRLRAASATGNSVTARRVFLSFQVAVSVVVLVGALLFVRTLVALRASDVGFQADRLLVLALSPQNAGRSVDQVLPFFRAAREAVIGLPGVAGATYGQLRPLANASWSAPVAASGCCPQGVSRAFRNVVGPSYFATMGIALIEGRDFTTADGSAAPKVAIVNEAFARAYGGGRSVLGGRIGVSQPEYTIVGVAKDAKYSNVREPAPPLWVIPYEQHPNVKYLDLYVRASGDAAAIATSVRAAIASVDPDVALFEVRTLEAQRDRLLAVERTMATLATFFGAIGAMLAALGVYGVLAFVVSTRGREIALRLALGARPAAIVRQVTGESLVAVGVGIAIGAATAAALSGYARSLLYDVQPLDPISFAAGVLVMAALVAAAVVVPARRASRVDPTRALREI
jgi:predicted permease